MKKWLGIILGVIFVIFLMQAIIFFIPSPADAPPFHPEKGPQHWKLAGGLANHDQGMSIRWIAVSPDHVKDRATYDDAVYKLCVHQKHPNICILAFFLPNDKMPPNGITKESFFASGGWASYSPLAMYWGNDASKSYDYTVWNCIRAGSKDAPASALCNKYPHGMSDMLNNKAFYNEPINPAITRLPKYFKGADIKSLYDQLDSLMPKIKKGEFETTAQYDKRLKKLYAQPILGEIKIGDTVAFSFSVSSTALSYNADKRTLDFSGRGVLNHSLENINNAQILLADSDAPYIDSDQPTPTAYYLQWKEDLTPMGSYVGSNAFGVSKTIDKYKTTDWGIMWCKTDPVYCRVYPKGLFVVSMTPEQARSAIKSAVYVILGTIDEHTPVIKRTESHTPTIDEPQGSVEQQDVINFKASQIWLANQKTGEIYKKISLKYLKEIRASR